jgi:hypothetical protein
MAQHNLVMHIASTQKVIYDINQVEALEELQGIEYLDRNDEQSDSDSGVALMARRLRTMKGQVRSAPNVAYSTPSAQAFTVIIRFIHTGVVKEAHGVRADDR